MRISSVHFILLVQLVFINSLAASQLPQPLVETAWLAQNLEHVEILDVRLDKKSFTATPIFKKYKDTGKQQLTRVGGHIPGAGLVLYKHVRDDQELNGITIKYMLPDKNSFEQLMQKAGMNQNSNIVIVTNAENDFDLTMASRVYWQIKYYGHENVSILNGGTAQWLIDGRDISSNRGTSSAGDWIAKKEFKELLVDSKDIVSAMENAESQIVDVRPFGQYLGTYKSSKVAAKGHIPTAKSYPIDLAASRGMPAKFTSLAELKEVTTALGVNTSGNVIVYCNSGHMASGGWFVLHELLGNKQAKLYDGSMHQWTAEKRPVVKMKLE